MWITTVPVLHEPLVMYGFAYPSVTNWKDTVAQSLQWDMFGASLGLDIKLLVNDQRRRTFRNPLPRMCTFRRWMIFLAPGPADQGAFAGWIHCSIQSWFLG